MARRKKGTGSKTQIGENKWLLRWRDRNGGQHSKRFNGTETQAERALRKLIYEAENAQAKADITLNEFSKLWLEEYAKINCKPRTYESYEETLRVHILPALGRHKLKDISRQMAQKFLSDKLEENSKHGRPRATTSVEYMQTVMKMVYNAAIEWEYAETNPAVLKHTMKFDKIAEIREDDDKVNNAVIMTEQQIHDLLRLARDDYFYPAYIIALETGLRRGEILGLKWPNIDFRTGLLSIKKAVQRLRGKGIKPGKTKSATSVRDVVIGPNLIEILRQHRKEQLRTKMKMGQTYHEENWVFCRPDGKLWDPKTMYSHFKKLAKKAGLPKRTTLRHLRHNYTTHCIDAGHKRSEVSKYLGHADEIVTKVYDKETYKRKKKAALDMESLIFPDEPQSQQESQY
jgi:integrase